jgi:predicted glycosyltransferase
MFFKGDGKEKMKILIELGHPGQVHLFKYTIKNLIGNGHKVKIGIKEKEGIVSRLLELYGLKYENIGKNVPSLLNKVISALHKDIKLFQIAYKFKPDIFVSIASPYSGVVSKLFNKSHLTFTDTEDAVLSNALAFPLTSVILTPDCFKAKVPLNKHVKYRGYHELAYLHPNWFKPDSSVLDNLDLAKDDKFIIVRFSSWDASHDIGQRGFNSMEERITFIKTLEKYGKIFVTSEIPLPKSLEKNRLNISPEKIHDLLYYATMYIGGGATLASEAGVLGVPWIWISAGQMRGYLEDQEKNYGLGYCLRTPQQALERAIELLESVNLKSEWQKKKEKLLNRKIDVTKFMTWFIENYPESFEIMKENTRYQERFK